MASDVLNGAGILPLAGLLGGLVLMPSKIE